MRAGEPRGADRVQLLVASPGVPENCEDPHRRRRRRASAVISVPATVRTRTSAFLPWSFDSRSRAPASPPDARPRASLVVEAENGLHLGGAARVRLREDRHRLRVHGVHAARRVMKRPVEHNLHRPPEEPGSEAPRRGGLVPLPGEAVSAGSGVPRSNCHVALARAHDLDQLPQLLDWMLPVRVDPAAVLVAVLRGVAVARRDRRTQPAILAERAPRRPARARCAVCGRSSRRRRPGRPRPAARCGARAAPRRCSPPRSRPG